MAQPSLRTFRQVPTLPDPNEVNSSVMADPFNMDHLKARLQSVLTIASSLHLRQRAAELLS